LRNPTHPVYAASETTEVQAAAHALGMELTLMNVSIVDEIESTFSKSRVEIGRRAVCKQRWFPP